MFFSENISFLDTTKSLFYCIYFLLLHSFRIQLAETEFCTDHCHSAVLGDLDTMNKELLALEEKFLRLGGLLNKQY